MKDATETTIVHFRYLAVVCITNYYIVLLLGLLTTKMIPILGRNYSKHQGISYYSCCMTTTSGLKHSIVIIYTWTISHMNNCGNITVNESSCNLRGYIKRLGTSTSRTFLQRKQSTEGRNRMKGKLVLAIAILGVLFSLGYCAGCDYKNVPYKSNTGRTWTINIYICEAV